MKLTEKIRNSSRTNKEELIDAIISCVKKKGLLERSLLGDTLLMGAPETIESVCVGKHNSLEIRTRSEDGIDAYYDAEDESVISIYDLLYIAEDFNL